MKECLSTMKRQMIGLIWSREVKYKSEIACYLEENL